MEEAKPILDHMHESMEKAMMVIVKIAELLEKKIS